MFDKSRFSLLALLLAACLSVSFVTPSRADDGVDDPGESSRVLSMVLLGDSYSAGNGAGSYDTAAKGTYRSANSWANVYRKWLIARGVAPHLTNLAHSGYTTDQVIEEQVNKIPGDADVVMLTIGGE